jgi:hypothetical protein
MWRYFRHSAINSAYLRASADAIFAIFVILWHVEAGLISLKAKYA